MLDRTEGRAVMKNRVNEIILISKENDWEKFIKSQIINNTNFEIEENYLPKNYLDKLFTELLDTELAEGSYYTFNLNSKIFSKRTVLDLSLVTNDVDKFGELNKVSKFEFRTKEFNEIAKDLKANHSSLVDPLVGIFKGHYRGIADSMPLIAFDAKLGTRSFDAYGRANTYKKAYFTGLLEGLERFHSVGSIHTQAIIASEKELIDSGKAFVPFQKFCHYTWEHYRSRHFELGIYSPEKPIRWINTYSVKEEREILIPEQIAYFSSEQVLIETDEEKYISETSNGTAVGSCWTEAAIAGIFELIERDSFLVYWYTKSSPIKVTNLMECQDKEIKMILGYINMMDYEPHLFDITLESNVPTYWLLLEYKGDDPDALSFYTAAGSNLNPYSAIKSAFVEATTSIKVFKEYMYKKYSIEEMEKLKRDFNEVKKLEDHLYLYSSETMKQYLDFALKTGKNEELKSNMMKRLPDDKEISQSKLLHDIVSRITEDENDIYITDLSTKFLTDIGLSCVKVHIPEYQNIGFGSQYQNVNLERLMNAIKLNNLDGNLDDIYQAPHPFP